MGRDSSPNVLNNAEYTSISIIYLLGYLGSLHPDHWDVANPSRTSRKDVPLKSALRAFPLSGLVDEMTAVSHR